MEEKVKRKGNKHDTGKRRWHLLPSEAAEEVVRVLEFGATKYGDYNWQKGLEYSALFNATERHLRAWWYRREDVDPESGISHLAHAACNILFLLSFVIWGRSELDDRPELQRKK
jgi:hypothetical protein